MNKKIHEMTAILLVIVIAMQSIMVVSPPIYHREFAPYTENTKCIIGDTKERITLFTDSKPHFLEIVLQILDVLRNFIEEVKDDLKRRKQYRELLDVHVFLVVALAACAASCWRRTRATHAGP